MATKKQNVIKVSLQYQPGWDQDTLNQKIENQVVDVAVNRLLTNIEGKLTNKVEQLVSDQAMSIIENLDEIRLTPCSTNGLKETVTLKQFIIQKALDVLKARVDESSGRKTEYSGISYIEYIVKKLLSEERSKFYSAVKKEIEKVSETFTKSLEEIVSKLLAPEYLKLRKKLKIGFDEKA